MILKLYNTLTRKKQVFQPFKSVVSIYTCGPTVYQFAHIGNLRTYIFEDLLKRTLFYNKFKVKHVMNITDVGHLTSDSDEGEDKLEKGAKRENKSVWDIAEFYTKAFRNDLEKLNIIPPNIWCKATDHIQDQIRLIQILQKKGYTYESDKVIYFDTSKFKNYTKLSRQKLEEKKIGSREEVEIDKDKKHPADFVLWFKRVGKYKNHTMHWPSPFSDGFPGWHIECSAMSMKYLGSTIDIHCGGIDHISIHHTNEIAQSEAATNKKFVRYWLHGEFLVIDQGKMAKSGENFITLQTLIDKNYSPLHYRYFCLNTHYRKPLTFSYEALDSAKNSYERLKENILNLKENPFSKKVKNNYEKRFISSINDDLNIPRALAVIWNVIKDKKLGNKEKLTLILNFDKVLGLKLDSIEQDKIPQNIIKLAEKRLLARKTKDWKLSDSIRDEINKEGYLIEDTENGFRIKKK